jgi:thiamine pyrophosphate-dependent acetolactate synthase large subunit-like protein
MCIKSNKSIQPILNEFLSQEGPCVLEVFTDPDEFHEPKVVAKLDEYGKFIPGELKNIQWIK